MVCFFSMTNEIPNLNIIEIFASVQGETSRTGLPSSFVRLASCNLRCSWCDTTYSFGRGNPISLSAIIEKIDCLGCKHVCITGGEPLLQENVYDLMKRLCDAGYVLNLETGGSLSIDRVDLRVHVILDVKCPGSEMSSKNFWPNFEFLKADDEVKFVIKDRLDYQYSKEICLQYHLWNKAHILFSPVHHVLDPQLLVSWILEDKLAVRLNLQMHKYIWSPDTKGV
jgi:7-carboxy-7-deazaguanine synthase